MLASWSIWVTNKQRATQLVTGVPLSYKQRAAQVSEPNLRKRKNERKASKKERALKDGVNHKMG